MNDEILSTISSDTIKRLNGKISRISKTSNIFFAKGYRELTIFYLSNENLCRFKLPIGSAIVSAHSRLCPSELSFLFTDFFKFTTNIETDNHSVISDIENVEKSKCSHYYKIGMLRGFYAFFLEFEEVTNEN